MTGIKILFLCSGDQMCRCRIAKRVLQLLDTNLEVYSAVIAPLNALSEVRKNAMEKLGYEISDDDLNTFDELCHIEFDYLITVSNGVRESLKKHPRNYRYKLHMEFSDFCTGETTEAEAISLFRKIESEVEDELGYFYSHILNKADR